MPAALVTGSSRGIGRAVALALAAKGADVALHYRRDEAAAHEAAAAVAALGRRAVILRAELAEEGAAGRLVDAAVDAFGRLDSVIANAASTAFKPLLEAGRRHAARTFETVVYSFLELAQAASPHLGDGGRLVTVSGFDTIRALPDHGLLGAAKAALEQLTRYLAVELGPRGITVNSVMPGYVDTASARFYADTSLPGGWEAAARGWAAATPLGRVADPADIADVVAFLCSPEARWLTGHVLVADGGLTLR
ncbi:MAG: SDR family oxidoreductase [Acidimicrobiales bacterium]